MTDGTELSSRSEDFETAPSETDWLRAAWIGGAVRAESSAAAPLVRTQFRTERPIKRARLHLAAAGLAQVRINGEDALNEVLAPGFSDYRERIQFASTDVTPHIRRGDNAICIEIGRGFFGMTNPNTWGWHEAPWHGEPAVRALIELVYDDGSRELVPTDGAWTSAVGPTTYDDLYGGEDYDARRIPIDHDRVTHRLGWAPAHVVIGPSGRLVARRQQPVRVTETLLPECITRLPDGSFVATYSRVIAGSVRISARGGAGSTIELRYGEQLRDDGTPNCVDLQNFITGRFQTDRFTLAGSGKPETWAARFSYKGFRYVQVIGWPSGTPDAQDLIAEVVHTDAARTASFTCTSRTMTRIHDITVDTVLNNLHHLPTDTPKYEKNGWTGDGMVGAELILTNLDASEIMAKWIDDIADSRDGFAQPALIAPSPGWGTGAEAPPWHAAYVLVPLWLYRYRGDSRVVSEHFEGIARYVRFEYARSNRGIARTTLGDWVSPETSPAGGNAPEDAGVSATAYLYAMLRATAEMARLQQREEDSAEFEQLAAEVKSAFEREFWHAETAEYRGNGDSEYRQTHNLLAVALGLVADSDRQRVVDGIARDVRSRGGALTTGALGTKFLLPVLTAFGHGDVAIDVAERTEFPGWGHWISLGATTLWEHWRAESRSRGHYFLGTIDDWLFGDVLGIRPLAAAYAEVLIRPAVTAYLDGAEGRVETPYGTLTVRWAASDDVLLELEIPPGVIAHIHTPSDGSRSVGSGSHSMRFRRT